MTFARDPAPPAATSAWFVTLAAAVLFGLGGLVFGLYPMVLTGLERTIFDWGDTRFVNYLLEHGYRWLLRDPHHARLWDPPFFYPAKGVLAYSESMLGAAPFYWPWRLVGFPPDTSSQLWFLTIALLNFVAAALLLRRCFRLSPPGAALGAFFFAYANARITQAMHHQLFPHAYSVLCVYALFRIFAPLSAPSATSAAIRGLLAGTRDDRVRAAWIAAFFAGVALQLYASFYLGWFLLFCLLLAGTVALAIAPARLALRATLARYPGAVVLCGALAAAAVAPMALRYLHASAQVGVRSFDEVDSYLPRPLSWADLGPANWMYRRWYAHFAHLPSEQEHRLGFGPVTTVLCVAGLAVARRRTAVRLVALTALALVLVVTRWGPHVAPWRVVYDVLPGAQAVRAVARIGLQLLLPVGLGVGLLYDALVARRLWWVAVPLACLAIAEQFTEPFSFSKTLDRRDIAAIVAAIPRGCEAFFFTAVGGRGPDWKYQNDAMMASLAADLPTLNGYSGWTPPGWRLDVVNLVRDGDAERAAAAYRAWTTRRGLDPATTCWVRVPVNDGDNAAEVVSQEVPTRVAPGERFDARVRMRNVGFRTWTAGGSYRLGTQGPRDNTMWGIARAELLHDVPSGREVTFALPLTAPAMPGTYRFEWQMVQDGVTWFGPRTEAVTIEVVAR